MSRSQRSDGLDVVRDNREEFETVAESDLPANWLAQALLDAADDAETNGR